MAVYQNLFNQLKTQLEADTDLAAFLNSDIVYGNRDAKIDLSSKQRYLLVEPLGITEPKATIPKRRWADPWEVELRGKVQDSVDLDLILLSYEIFEKVGNAIFSSSTFGGLAVGIEFSMASNNVIGENTREIIMLLQIHSQPFQEDSR